MICSVQNISISIIADNIYWHDPSMVYFLVLKVHATVGIVTVYSRFVCTIQTTMRYVIIQQILVVSTVLFKVKFNRSGYPSYAFWFSC
jgi:hypothetical protein